MLNHVDNKVAIWTMFDLLLFKYSVATQVTLKQYFFSIDLIIKINIKPHLYVNYGTFSRYSMATSMPIQQYNTYWIHSLKLQL